MSQNRRKVTVANFFVRPVWSLSARVPGAAGEEIRMSATPVYDAVLRDLKIDPERIAARPPWSFELAERVRKHRKKEVRSAARKVRPDDVADAPVLTGQA